MQERPATTTATAIWDVLVNEGNTIHPTRWFLYQTEAAQYVSTLRQRSFAGDVWVFVKRNRRTVRIERSTNGQWQTVTP